MVTTKNYARLHAAAHKLREFLGSSGKYGCNLDTKSVSVALELLQKVLKSGENKQEE